MPGVAFWKTEAYREAVAHGEREARPAAAHDEPAAPLADGGTAPQGYERLASQIGNQAFSRAVARSAADPPPPDLSAARSRGRLAQRQPPDKDKEKEKYKGPTPDTPFELTEQEHVRIEKLAVEKLRVLVTGTVGQAYTNFSVACVEAKTKIATEEKEEAEAQAKMLDFVFGAVGMLLGPVGSAVASKASGAAIQSQLLETVRKELPGLELPGGVVNGALIPARRIPSGLEARIASDTVTKLAEKLTPEKAEGLLGAAAGKVADTVKKLKIGPSPHQTTISFVNAMQEAAHPSAEALRTTVAASDDAGALLAIHGRFVGATPAVYRAEVDAKAHHFLEQVGRTTSGGHSVALVNAYGKERLCTYSQISDDLWSGISYHFESWVTPDMQPMVFALNPNPVRMRPDQFRNHVPEPTIEAADGREGGTAIVKMNAYGRMRLANVKALTGLFDKSGTYKFMGWVGDEEEAEATARGQLQLAGIPEIDPSRIDGHLPEPPAAKS